MGAALMLTVRFHGFTSKHLALKLPEVIFLKFTIIAYFPPPKTELRRKIRRTTQAADNDSKRPAITSDV